MRIFPAKTEVGQLEGFDPAKDIFKRANIGRGLTNLVGCVSDPLVIAVDGPWGTGKSTFLKMWAGELRKAGFPVVYFDAFANDYIEDAFAAIASQLIELVAEYKKSKAPAGKVFKEKAVKAAKVLTRSALKVGIKVATVGVIDDAHLKEIAGAVAGEASDLADKYVGELITKQRERADNFRAFRDALTELPRLLATSANENSPAARPLIFIRDELDRCRPAFAIELLDRMKHFFSVPNIHFILGTHLAQLQNSVAVMQGPSVDAQTY